jgi:hypothetical protein
MLALGVELIVIVFFVAFVLGRRRWWRHQPGAFVGAIRVPAGKVDGLHEKWKHGSGRWVRDVFVWSNAPLMIRNALIPVDQLAGERIAHDGEVKRLGKGPEIISLTAGEATIEVATKPDHRTDALGPFPAPATVA